MKKALSVLLCMCLLMACVPFGALSAFAEEDSECEHTYRFACEQYCYNCGEKTNPKATHSIVAVPAKAAVNCIEYGNKAYWNCEYCNGVWLDAQCMRQSNMMSVRVAGECVSNAPVCKDGECIHCGLPCGAEVECTYDNACDTTCNTCGETREVAEHTYVDGVCSECGYGESASAATLGDTNDDGKINNRDLGLLQQYLNDWDVTIHLDACDVNGDGKINNRDLGLLQQYLNDWDVTFG